MCLSAALGIGAPDASGSDDPPDVSHRAHASPVTLFDQYDHDGSSSIVSYVNAGDASLTSQGADDLFVPGGETWTLGQVDVKGTANVVEPTGFNVRIYDDSGGLPGTLVAEQLDRPAGGTSPDYVVSFNPAVTLHTGVYWVSVQALVSSGDWFWETRSVIGYAEAAWQNPGGGWGQDCTAWKHLSDCSFGAADYMFKLVGTKTAKILYDQYLGDLSNAFISEVRTDDAARSAEAADDFAVPAGKVWTVTEVDARTGSGPGTPSAFDVHIYRESGTFPGSLVAQRLGRPVGGPPSDPVVTLHPSVTLEPGTYWVSIEATTTGADWGWEGSNVGNFSGTAWRNPSDFYVTGCTDWTRLTTCSAQNWPGMMFRIDGTSQALVRRPDALVKRSSDHAYMGNNVSNATGRNQTASASAHRGKTQVFDVEIQNDGNAGDAFFLKGAGGAAGFKVSYLRGAKGTTSITSKVVAGKYRTAVLAPGAATIIRFAVTISGTAGIGSAHSWVLSARSANKLSALDAVKAVVKVLG